MRMGKVLLVNIFLITFYPESALLFVEDFCPSTFFLLVFKILSSGCLPGGTHLAHGVYFLHMGIITRGARGCKLQYCLVLTKKKRKIEISVCVKLFPQVKDYMENISQP